MNNLEIVLIPAIVGAITQTTKFIIFSFKHGFNINYFMTHGHMPSSHSAFATALLVAVWRLEGVNSAAFAVAAAVAILIIDDAVRLRMYLGDQGRYLNMLIESLHFDENQYPRLKERVGHRTSEVIVGIIYGGLLSFLLVYLFDKI